MPFTDPFVANPYPYSFACTLASANQLYDVTQALVAGVYTISWSGGGTLYVDFYNGTTFVTNATGTSSITLNLAQGITNFKICNSVGPVSVVISLSALAIATVSGTLYTFTNSQTITLTGNGYCVIVGGGGASSNGGYGGGSGGITGGPILLTGSLVLTIGLGGTPTATNGNAGGTTTLGPYTATGGGGGQSTPTALGGTAGTPNGSPGANATVSAQPTASAAAASGLFFMTMGTTGPGASPSHPTAAGSGIGTGGAYPGGTPSGFGAGAGYSSPGIAGTPGVCYLIV